MIEATFCSEFHSQTKVCFCESLVVENTTCDSLWRVVITGICYQLFEEGVKNPLSLLLKYMCRLGYFTPEKKEQQNELDNLAPSGFSGELI